MNGIDNDITILAIETSCDETAAAVVKNGRRVLSNIISSQIETHKLYGGVVPEIASRKHIESIDSVVKLALEEAEVLPSELSAVAVTYGPGLVGALLVGISHAKALAFALGKPLIGVHHIEGHISANYIEDTSFEPPFIALVVSGGHTNIVSVSGYGQYEILGGTRDDAAGEAYDKVARAIGMGYPGGPKIDAAAKLGNAEAIAFPRAYLEEGSLDFSFSGLKSAVLNYINTQRMNGGEICANDVAASFQKSVVDVLVEKTMAAAIKKGVSRIAMAGGVASNTALRQRMKKSCEENGFSLNIPSAALCTDNAAMIASAAYYEYIRGLRSGLDLNAVPGLRLG